MLEVLDAVQDEDVLALNAEAEEVVEEKKEEKPAPSPVPQVDNAAVAREILRVLEASRPQGQPQPTRLEREVNRMLNEGVHPDAIEKILRLREADRADEADRLAQKANVQTAQNFNQQCWAIAEEQLKEYSKNIPFLKDAKQGLTTDLLDEVNQLISNGSDYASVRNQIANRVYPDKAKVGEAVAKVVDKFCKDKGITKKAAPLEIRSSKAETAERPFSEADVDKLSKGAKQIYASTLKHTNDPKKALKRAQQYAAEVG